MRLGLWFKQAGEGCDYTVGCGEKLVTLESTNIEDAKAESIEILQGYGFKAGSEREVEEIMIVEFVDSIKPGDIEEAVEPEDPETVARRNLYETLKREFG